MKRCKNGHVLDEGNSYLCCDGAGHPFRRCRQCHIERAKRWRANNTDWIKTYDANRPGGRYGKEHSLQG